MSLPARIRVNAAFPFPAMVQGSGPISIAKSNGIWTVGYDVSRFAVQVPGGGSIATDYVTVWDSVAKQFINVSLASIEGSGLGIATPEQFGAKGDGIADDTTAFQAAMDSGSILFLRKTYLCSNLTVNNDLRIFGAGPDAGIVFKAGATGYLLAGSTTFYLQLDSLSLIGGVLFDHEAITSPGTRSGVHLWANINNTSITNCFIAGFDNIGIGINGDTGANHIGTLIADNTIYGNYIGIDTGPGGANYDTGLGSAAGGEYLSITSNGIQYCRYGLVVDSGNVDAVANRLIKNGYGLYISGSVPNEGHGTFSSNLCNHSLVYAVFTTPFVTTGYAIIGNQFFGGDWLINSGDGFTITGNTIEAPNFTLQGTGWYSIVNNWFISSPNIVDTNTRTVWNGNYDSVRQQYIKNSAPLLVDPIGASATFNPTTTGSQLIVNGGFASGASWTTGSGWTISGGKANCSGSPFSELTQTMSGITQNTLYQVILTISNYVSGSLGVGIGGAILAVTHAGNGTYTDIVNTGGSVDQNLYLENQAFVGSVDDVSVLKYVSDGTLTISHAALNTVALATPTTQTGTAYSQTNLDSSIIVNSSGNFTLTLLSAASVPGRILMVKQLAAFTVASPTSNVCPLGSATPGTPILSGAGKWAMLESDGTNWVIIASN